MSDVHSFLLCAVGVTLFAAAIDLRTGHIPNWLTLGTLTSALLTRAILGGWRAHSIAGALQSMGLSALGAFVCALLPLVLYRAMGLGGGDVKLFAAIGALTDALVGLHAQTYAFVCGGLWAVAVLAWHRRLRATAVNVLTLFTSTIHSSDVRPPVAVHQRTEIRFGPAIFVGTLLAVRTCWSWS